MDSNNTISWQEYFMNIAKAVSQKSTCISRNYGALIVKDNKIWSTGYNGAASGMPECSRLGVCYRREHGIDHGKNYDSNCLSVHAEANAIINCDPEKMKDSTIYIYGKHFETGADVEQSGPCIMCYRMIRNAKIQSIVIINNGKLEEYSVQSYGVKYFHDQY